MAFKLKNKGLKKIIGQLKNSATMHAKQAEKLESMSPAKLKGKSMGPRKSPRDNMKSASDIRKQGGRKLVDKTKDKSPMKGKLKPCQKAAAKRKFKVYPSAYANMWASNYKC